MSLRDVLSYDFGHQWRFKRRAGDFDLIFGSVSWGRTGVTVHVALLGPWVAVHYVRVD